jgi:hypothetical protein
MDTLVSAKNSTEKKHFQLHWVWAAILVCLVAGTVALRYALPIRDGDIWFHILYGEYFWQHKTLIPDHTIFSWTPATNVMIYCAWLSELFFYFLHNIFGLTGLFVFRYCCIYCLMIACFLYARQLKVAAQPITWWICLLAVHMSYSGIVAKPEIISYLFMLFFAWNWWHIRVAGSRAWKNCYLFPLIMLLWVNSHGGFVFGVIFLIVIVIGEGLNSWLSPENALLPKVRKHLFIALPIAFFCLFLTPYGLQYPFQLIQFIVPTRGNMTFINHVAAYRSPFHVQDQDALGFVLLVNLSILTLLTLYIRNFRSVDWSSLLLNFVFVLLYTRFYRTTFYWSPIFLFSCLFLSKSKQLIPAGRKTWVSILLLPTVTLFAILFVSGVLLRQAVRAPEMDSGIGFDIGAMNPVAEAEYIR